MGDTGPIPASNDGTDLELSSGETGGQMHSRTEIHGTTMRQAQADTFD